MNSLQGVLFFGIFSLALISATEYEGEDFLQGDEGYGGGHDSGYESGGHGGGEDYDHHPQYHFEYTVHDPHTHDFKSHHEVREGDTVKGYYTLKEADGSLREVHYTADHKNGFQAVVTQNGKQIHPHVETGHKSVISHGPSHYQGSSDVHDSSHYQDASHYY